jgi:hypothetical protein
MAGAASTNKNPVIARAGRESEADKNKVKVGLLEEVLHGRTGRQAFVSNFCEREEAKYARSANHQRQQPAHATQHAMRREVVR